MLLLIPLDAVGSPAHAGIDLQYRLSYLFFRWFPRTRGDRPGLDKAFRAICEVPPHTRG